MGTPKGKPKSGGRKPGTPNKTTSAVKAALVSAFEDMGGVEALVKWGKANRTEFYKLWGRLIPTEIKNADGTSFRMAIVEEIVEAAVAEDGAASDNDSGPTG